MSNKNLFILHPQLKHGRIWEVAATRARILTTQPSTAPPFLLFSRPRHQERSAPLHQLSWYLLASSNNQALMVKHWQQLWILQIFRLSALQCICTVRFCSSRAKKSLVCWWNFTQRGSNRLFKRAYTKSQPLTASGCVPILEQVLRRQRFWGENHLSSSYEERYLFWGMGWCVCILIPCLNRVCSVWFVVYACCIILCNETIRPIHRWHTPPEPRPRALWVVLSVWSQTMGFLPSSSPQASKEVREATSQVLAHPHHSAASTPRVCVCVRACFTFLFTSQPVMHSFHWVSLLIRVVPYVRSQEPAMDNRSV